VTNAENAGVAMRPAAFYNSDENTWSLPKVTGQLNQLGQSRTSGNIRPRIAIKESGSSSGLQNLGGL
jgi:hypothetical protein